MQSVAALARARHVAAFGHALAPMGIKVPMVDPLYSKNTLVPTLMGKYHVGFDLSPTTIRT